ncbi:MAG: hypothetical protein LBE49_09325 [Deltaproteobacteria bacterium]|jgi:nucleoside phosphorylase|nr:hypothetical protein [Deltaproteobacteria bacterium]
MSALRELIIFTPTPNEYRAVSRHMGLASFKKLTASVIECGPGRINAAYHFAQELLHRRRARERPIVVGAGTSGSLSLELARGDVLVSGSAIISDWRMEDGETVKVSPYGTFDYREPDPEHVERMAIECREPLVVDFIESLKGGQLKFGRMLTSEAFVSGKEHKLALGRLYGCPACDMESGVFGYLAGKSAQVPWFNVRVIADTLDDALNDYFAVERDVTDILGGKLVAALEKLDALL